MKNISKMVGVTLLEVMLVLAVAAMIIVMSIRYYQSANTNQQVNGGLSMIQGIAAAADGLSQGTGSFVDATQADIGKLMPGGPSSLTTPWGTPATITGQTTSSYVVTLPSAPEAVCIQILSRIKANTKYSTTTTCSGTTDIALTYTATN